MRGFKLASALLCVVLGCSSTKPFATSLSPRKANDIDMQFELARANETDGQLTKAESAYRSLCKAQPNVAKYQQRLGVVLIRLGHRSEGLATLQHAHEMDPSNPNILNDLGYAHLQGGEPAKAAEHFKRTLQIEPQNQRANNNLALALGYDGELKESFRLFQNTMSEAEALSNLGYLATQNGKSELAVKAFSRALTLEPDSKSAAEALTQLALLQQGMDESRSIASDLNASSAQVADDETPTSLNDEESPKPAKVAVRSETNRTSVGTASTSSPISAKLLLSDFDE